MSRTKVKDLDATLSIGAPIDEKTRSGYRQPYLQMIRVSGRPRYRQDAESLFRFLIRYIPDGTIQELIRLFDEKLDTISSILKDR